jgi:hypothetical protein
MYRYRKSLKIGLSGSAFLGLLLLAAARAQTIGDVSLKELADDNAKVSRLTKMESQPLQALAAQGDADAEMEMARRAELGTGGLPKNRQESFAWYERAAEAGEDEAVLKLAKEYWFKDPQFDQWDEAQKLLQRARRYELEFGGEAEYDLGLMYLRGYGLPANPYKAEDYFEIASQHACPQAKSMLAILHAQQKAALVNASRRPRPDALKHFRTDVNRFGTLDYESRQVTDYGSVRSTEKLSKSFVITTEAACTMKIHWVKKDDGKVTEQDVEVNLAQDTVSEVLSYWQWSGASHGGAGVYLKVKPEPSILIFKNSGGPAIPELTLDNQDEAELVRAEFVRASALCRENPGTDRKITDD